MKDGFLKAAALSPALRVADCAYNAGQIAEQMAQCAARGVKLAVFPELALTGYTCGDLFFQQALQQALLRIAREQLVLVHHLVRSLPEIHLIHAETVRQIPLTRGYLAALSHIPAGPAYHAATHAFLDDHRVHRHFPVLDLQNALHQLLQNLRRRQNRGGARAQDPAPRNRGGVVDNPHETVEREHELAGFVESGGDFKPRSVRTDAPGCPASR